MKEEEENVSLSDFAPPPSAISVTASDRTHRIRLQAKYLYIHSRKSITEIARTLRIRPSRIMYWRRADKWVQARDEIRRELQERMRLDCLDVIRQHQLPLLRRQLDMTKHLESQILDKARTSKLSPVSIANLARAARDSAQVSQRLVGFDKDSGNSVTSNLIVQVNVTPDDPRHDEPEDHAIDVQSSEAHS